MATENVFFLTRNGLRKAKHEYDFLVKLKQSKLRNESPQMAVSQDVNPEYLTFYEDIGIIDLKISRLEKIIKNANIIQPPSEEKRDVVLPGAVVTVDDNGRKGKFELTDIIEANPAAGKISIASPVGSALLGHRAGDKVTVPAINLVYKILEIGYQIA